MGVSEKEEERKDSRLVMLFKGLKGAASIPTDDLVPPNRHSLAFPPPLAGTDIYKSNFFPQTTKDWNFRIARTINVRREGENIWSAAL